MPTMNKNNPDTPSLRLWAPREKPSILVTLEKCLQSAELPLMRCFKPLWILYEPGREINEALQCFLCTMLFHSQSKAMSHWNGPILQMRTLCRKVNLFNLCWGVAGLGLNLMSETQTLYLPSKSGLYTMSHLVKKLCFLFTYYLWALCHQAKKAYFS